MADKSMRGTQAMTTGATAAGDLGEGRALGGGKIDAVVDKW